MRIGYTFDLKRSYLEAGYGEIDVAEFEAGSTVEAIASALETLGHQVDPIGHLYDLSARLLAGERWDLVFNQAEGVRGFGREAAVPCLLDAYGIPYTFSDPATLAVCLHKAMAKRLVRDAGVPTPDFVLVETEADLETIDLDYPLFAKPVAEGSSKGISEASSVETPEELRQRCRRLLERYRQPVLVERLLPGRELTVGIVGTGARARALGVMEVVFGSGSEDGGYTYRNKTDWVGKVFQRLAPPEIAAEVAPLALRAWRALGGRDAGRIDFKLDAGGKPRFLEANPLAGLSPETADLTLLCGLLGIPYLELLREIVESASERVPEEVRLPAARPAASAAERRSGRQAAAAR